MRVITGDLPHPGKVRIGGGRGGMLYVVADVRQLKRLELIPEPGRQITRVSSLIGQATTGPLSWDDPSTWTGAIDRCPCGTGTCAKMAVVHAKGELALDRDFRHQGILGTVFTGRLVEQTTIGDKPAVVPTISGRSWIFGLNTLVLDHEDPLPNGYTLGDIWA